MFKDRKRFNAYQKKWRDKNKDRLREQNKLRKQRNRERDRDRLKAYQLNYEYGRGAYEHYLRQKEKQHNRCNICQQEQEVLYFDHCHRTGVFRPLLCDSCNLGLGKFNDDVNTLRRAISHLEGM